ncbi:hypothetical protein O3M35_001980 [Rhynocoris fuscipes]|uniref:Ubiquitin-conjugating enzyme E2 H n=1 Tax=Rhynocoris fuscipes TaxID=488301 RepID=A0AAW1CWY1_9HEMI
MESKHEVTLLDGLTELCVKVVGPRETPYEGAVWRVRVHLPDAYPFKSPSVAFMDPIIHPNVDQSTGAICLDVLNQTWSPLFSLLNVFDSFIPQLLTYPNPDHPMNRDAANTAIKEPEKFQKIVREHSAHLASVLSDKPPRKKYARRDNGSAASVQQQQSNSSPKKSSKSNSRSSSRRTPMSQHQYAKDKREYYHCSGSSDSSSLSE